MADLSFNGAICEVPSLACCCSVVTTPSFPFDFLGILSSIDDIFSHLVALTTYISRRFFYFIEDLVIQDICRCLEDFQSSARYSSVCEAAPETCFSSTFSPNTETGLVRESPVNTRSEVVETRYASRGVSFIFQGLTLPFLYLRLAWRMALTSLNYITEVHVRGLICRVQKTLRGSSDDIGWLQRTPGMDPAVDRTDRFLELLKAIRNGEHKLPDSFVYLLIPGLFSNHGPLYFVTTKRFFSKMGLACHIAKIHSEASVEHNAWVLKQYIEELFWGSGKRVMLLGHSKGGVDAAAALSIYWDELKDKVGGLALVQSPYGGTPIASDILREGQIADKETRRIMEFLICKLIKGDIRSLEDLTYEKRKDFITNHVLPDQVPLISFHSEAGIAPGVLSTMTQIAHAEIPWLPFLSFKREEYTEYAFQRGRLVPVVIPISAAMALCALHLQLRYGEKSDGLVMCRDAEVPGSVLVKPKRKLDHSFMVYASSSSRKDENEADASEMCEALLTMLVEIGRVKEEEEKEKKGKELKDFKKTQ